MRRPGVTIGAWLGAVGACAVALAVLRWADEAVAASVQFALLALFWLALGFVLHGAWPGRAYWGGFLLAGGAFAVLTTLPGLPDSALGALPTSRALGAAHDWLTRPEGMTRAELVDRLLDADRGATGLHGGTSLDATAFRDVAHGLLAVGLGLAGGGLARTLARRGGTTPGDVKGRGPCPSDAH